jgi:leucine dehydrogenase
MDHDLVSLLRGWDGEAVVARCDRETGTWIFIALHSTVLGRPVGGTRMRVYSSPAEGLRDAQRLGEAMTAKWAALELPIGGGKAVLAMPEPLSAEARHGLLIRYGKLVESLRGAFGTGEDLGTTPEDMALIAKHTRFVHGVEGGGRVADPGPFTARGVFRGIEAAARVALGRESVDGVEVLIQGAGDVGFPLGQELAAAGARLTVADPDAGRRERAERELGARIVAVEEAIATPCDVFAPCAVGGVLDAASIPRLACRVVAGSANSQLEEAADAERLRERGITYVPDYIVNAGGAYAFALHGEGEHDAAALLARMDRIGRTVEAILVEARERGESPLHAAERRVQRVLQRAAELRPVELV